jgi:hypothetical protein
MADEWTIEAARTVTETEQASPTIRELSLFVGDSYQPSALVVVVGVRDDLGNWRADIAPAPVRFEGDEAGALIALLMGALVAEGEHAGITVKEAGKTIIRARMETSMEPAPPPPDAPDA